MDTMIATDGSFEMVCNDCNYMSPSQRWEIAFDGEDIEDDDEAMDAIDSYAQDQDCPRCQPS